MDDKKITQFLFEIGTLRRVPRMHRQTLLIDDTSDNIATHSYRVGLIGWFLAKMEKADPYKVVMMCLCHDMSEARTGDHNWVHKRYVKIFEEEIRKDQLGTLPFNDLRDLAGEYDARESKEAIIAKDADILDQLLLLKEYAWQGSREAELWLTGKDSSDGLASGNKQLQLLRTESAKRLGEVIFSEKPSDWWNNIWTHKNK
ncbi:HD domain-containing protein [Candidatus Parcubacteria bacterium]|nr:HD domain-containing protein [Candidatus Parcubacteria bacterium]